MLLHAKVGVVQWITCACREDANRGKYDRIKVNTAGSRDGCGVRLMVSKMDWPVQSRCSLKVWGCINV